MGRNYAGQGTTKKILSIPGYGIILSAGTARPADTEKGYGKGCLFIDTDSTGGVDVWYQNIGDASSANFDVLPQVSELANLDGLTTTVTELNLLSGLLATAAEINRATKLSTRIVDCTASTLSVTLALHDGKIVTLNRAAGIAVSLPAATGTGAKFKFFVGTTVTTTNVITFTRAGSDTFFGQVYQLADAGDTLAAYELPGSTIITLGTSSNSTGGTKGDWLEFEDVASAVWHVVAHTTAAGTEATPVT